MPTRPFDPAAPAPGRPRGWDRWYLAVVTLIVALFAISHSWTTVDRLVLHARGVRVAATVDRFHPAGRLRQVHAGIVRGGAVR